jgi:hypothetical protein
VENNMGSMIKFMVQMVIQAHKMKVSELNREEKDIKKMQKMQAGGNMDSDSEGSADGSGDEEFEDESDEEGDSDCETENYKKLLRKLAKAREA